MNAPDCEPLLTSLERASLVDVPLTGFMDAPPSTLGYSVFPILPRSTVTLWGGHGGTGKSTAALTVAAHGACGESWVGFAPDGMVRCLFVSLEDSGDVVRYRLRRICEAYNLPPAKIEQNLRVLDGTAGQSALMVEDNEFGSRKMVPTPLLEEVEEAAEGVDLILIDNASDAYAGNENERRSVRAFMRRLGSIARKQNAALVLLAHIDKVAARNGAAGNSYSGSTAWHNSARSRIAMIAQDESTVELVHEKHNFGKRAETVRLQWNQHGVLMLAAAEMRGPESDGVDAAAVLAVLAAADGAGIVVPTGTSGPATSLHAVAHLPELPEHLAKDRRRFFAVLESLSRRGVIERAAYRNADRKEKQRWQLAQITPGSDPAAPLRQSPYPYRGTGALAHWRSDAAVPTGAEPAHDWRTGADVPEVSP